MHNPFASRLKIARTVHHMHSSTPVLTVAIADKEFCRLMDPGIQHINFKTLLCKHDCLAMLAPYSADLIHATATHNQTL